jgi:hypothetical protein
MSDELILRSKKPLYEIPLKSVGRSYLEKIAKQIKNKIQHKILYSLRV